MSVYISKKRSRGVTGSVDPTIPGVINIDATSGSNNKISGYSAKQFSPMFLGPVKECRIFENYWQYSKVFVDLGHLDDNDDVTQKWIDFREFGFQRLTGDRHPRGTKTNEVKFVDNQGRRHFRYLTAQTSVYDDTFMDYITSRKRVYAPIYASLVSQTRVFVELKKMISGGLCVQILDIDAEEGVHEVTVELLREKINYSEKPFGHGYVLAGLLAGIHPEDYC